SDEPVLGPRERLLVASRTLAAGLPYVGADFRFDPPELHPVGAPSLAVIGTGKRVGKTAVTGHVARLLARDREVVVVAMGRGGPAQPVVAVVPPTLDGLLELSRAGQHAASDYLETAALSGVVTIGCRRAGRALKDIPVVRAELRLRPVVPLGGRSVAVFTTGPAPTEHLDAEVVSVSRNLADRARLREDLARTEADVYLVEIKAAAIDVV